MGLTAEDKPNHITDLAADAMHSVSDTYRSGSDDIPGPSNNPATNLLINEILLRSVGRMSRQTVQKLLLGRQYGEQFAKDAVENRSMLHSLAAYGVTKVATKSVPGAVLVSGALLAKVLFDRSQSRRKSRSAGRKMLRKQADPDSLA